MWKLHFKEIIKKKDKLGRRTLMCVIGVVVCSMGAGMCKLAAFGMDPFMALMAGLDCTIPIGFGNLYVIVNAILLLFAVVTDRHYIGLATMINLFGVGYITQYFYAFLQIVFQNITIIGRMIVFFTAIVIMCFSFAMYFTADLGVSTYDAVALVISETWKIGKFKYIRIITDFCCIIIAIVLFLLSNVSKDIIWANIGIGTFVTAFLMGPLISLFRFKVSEPFLDGTLLKKSKTNDKNYKY